MTQRSTAQLEELCPGCAYRPQGPDGLCPECMARRAPTGPACGWCGHVERNAAGDCAHCQRRRERSRYRPTGRPRGRPRIEGPCTAPGCGRPHHSRGLCRRHYLRQWRRAA
jgi:hypothetical protein